MKTAARWVIVTCAAAGLAWSTLGCGGNIDEMKNGLVDMGFSWQQVAVLRGASTIPGDDYACSVAISKDWAAVGCCGESGTGTVYLYRNSNDRWIWKQKLSGASASGFFGVSVAIAGPYLIIGAPGEGGSQRGAAHIYTLKSGIWGSEITLTAPGGGSANDRMGISVALSDQWAFVGVPYAASAAGQVYVYYRGTGAWANSLPATLTKTVPAGGDYFGWAISTSGTHTVIGCPQGIGSGGQGEAYVFARNGLYWGNGSNHPTSRITHSGTTVFGSSVAISDDSLIVGSPGNESAYIYARSGTAWTATRVFNPNGKSGDLFGTSVGISGTHAVIGATKNSSNGAGKGGASPFELSGSSWNIESDLTPYETAYGQLGNAASMADDYAIVAADDGGGAAIVGAAYIFKRKY